MSKRELIAREINRLPEPDLDRVLAFIRSLNDAPAATFRHANDWLTPDDEAWANL